MYAGISAQFLPALRGSHTAYGYMEAWRNGARVAMDDGTTSLPILESGSNQVAVDASTPGVRRTLSGTLAPAPGLFELLAPTGTELRAFVSLRYPTGAVETVPQGRFDVDSQKVGYGTGGTLTLTAPDRWVRIQNARFLAPRASTPGATARAQIAALLLEALPAGTSVTDIATSTATVPAQTWDRDRDQAIQDLATAASLDVYFDRNGNPVIRDAPVLNPTAPAWTVDAGANGVLLDASRERNRQKVYNLVVVNGSQVNGVAPFPTQYVWDANPTSATFAGSGSGSGPTPPSPSTAGPFGQRPYFYTSPLLANAAQAQAAGATILSRVVAMAAQLSLTSAHNPALDDGDTITVILPAGRRGLAQPIESHLVTGMTVPLVPSLNAMPITTRSTRPDDTSGA